MKGKMYLIATLNILANDSSGKIKHDLTCTDETT